MARRALGGPLRPPFVALLLSLAYALPLGPDGPLTCDFSNSRYGFENIMLSAKKACYQQKNNAIYIMSSVNEKKKVLNRGGGMFSTL